MRAGDFRIEAVAPGRGVRAAGVFFLELRGREAAAFFLLDFFLLLAFEADFFRVTLLFASLLLTDDLPALVTFFLLAFFLLAFFLLVFFLPVFFLLATFFFEVFLPEDFFRLLDFFLLGVFPALDFLDAGAAARLRDVFLADFFETLFLAAAFFLGIR